MSTTAYYSRMKSPLGEICLAGNDDSLTGLYMLRHKHWDGIDPTWKENDAPLAEARRQLAEYFAGERQKFDLPIEYVFGTPFQLRVWRELEQIPFGETINYGQLAQRVGRPGASRAVGAANGRNPISIIVPCHRVIGASGKLTGYGGGLDKKEWLLNWERGIIGTAPRTLFETVTTG